MGERLDRGFIPRLNCAGFGCFERRIAEAVHIAPKNQRDSDDRYQAAKALRLRIQQRLAKIDLAAPEALPLTRRA